MVTFLFRKFVRFVYEVSATSARITAIKRGRGKEARLILIVPYLPHWPVSCD